MQRDFRMLPQKNGLFPLKILFVLVFHLLLMHSCRGQSQVIGPAQPIVAHVGDDVILPCRLDPAEDAFAMMLEWTRPDLSPIFVHMRRAGQDVTHSKNPSYAGRTSVSVDELKHGDVSLRLSDVRPSDAGTYQCYLPKMDKGAFVTLVVGAVSLPAIVNISKTSSGVVLQCESEGWYPEPEVSWLDSEGHVLSAGPTETVRGPDGLYTVSSRVTVEKRQKNIFTCRVQQKNINQIRETQIHISDDFFQSSSDPVTITLAVLLALCSVFIFAVFFFVCKWRRKIIRITRSHRDETDKTKEGEGAPLSPVPNVEMKNKREKHASLNLYKCFKDEHQRRERAEREVEPLKEQVKNLTEEKQRVENERQQLQTDLENKTKEFTEEKQQLQTELENMRTKVDKLTAEVKKITEEKQIVEDERQKLETELKTTRTELEDNKREADRKQNETHEKLQEANNQLKNKDAEIGQLKNQLKEEKREGERKLKELKTRLESEVDKLTAEVTRLKEEKKRSEEELKKQVQTLTDEKKKLEKETKEVETLTAKVRDLDMKNKELQEKLQEEKMKREKAEEQVESLKNTEPAPDSDNSSGLESNISPDRSPLTLHSPQTTVTDTSEGEALMNPHTEDTASQNSATGCVFEVGVNPWGQYIRLKNTSREKQNLRGWKLQVQINNEKPIEYTFKETDKLGHGETVTLWVPGRGSHDPPFNLVWEDLKSWRRGGEPRVTLLSNNKEIISISQFIIER